LAGVLLSSLLSGISDTDVYAAKGAAIEMASTNNGSWWYTTNNGTTWSTVGTVSSSSALLLAANQDTRVYFKANNVGVGTYTNQLTLRAWDQTTGSAGTKVNPGVPGGSTAFSTATDLVTVVVAPMNNPPVLSAGAGVTYTEQATAKAIAPALTLSDPDTSPTADTITAVKVQITAGGDSNDQLYLQFRGGLFFSAPKAALGIETSVAEVQQVADMTVFPNPASDRLSFEVVDERTHVRMVDVRGAVVFESVLPAGSSAIDLSPFADGWYVLHLVGLQSNAVQRAPFLIRR
jgi:hypothetical protein